MLTTLRNNWKKSVFAASAAGYGIFSLKFNHDCKNYMRSICNEVVQQERQEVGNPCNRVLVVINPVANKGKAAKAYKQYCEPLLHLAGFAVETVSTNHVGHAKTYIENLNELPAAIIVAGGHGTSSEVVTGLLRRSDNPCPLVLLPLGKSNNNGFQFSTFDAQKKYEFIKNLSKSVLPLLKGNTEERAVIKYDVQTDKKDLKPIYGLSNFSYGLVRDIDSIKDKYWYFGFLRNYAAVFLNSFSKDFNWKFLTDYVYSPPCGGCSNCWNDHKQTPAAKTNSFFGNMIKMDSPSRSKMKILPTNENCSTKIEGHVEACQVDIKYNHNPDTRYELESVFYRPLSSDNYLDKLLSITHHDFKSPIVVKSRTIQLSPTLTDAAESSTCYTIDGEEYDVQPIKISLIPNAIKVYC